MRDDLIMGRERLDGSGFPMIAADPVAEDCHAECADDALEPIAESSVEADAFTPSPLLAQSGRISDFCSHREAAG